uniref:DUF4144 family protein n=1 Tax=Thaumasiovibrio subtropicus TaxID=1891207 RepID=UPI000B360541|nr:DUF4144 family protein [Thaumasiovibrio subtropicus]
MGTPQWPCILKLEGDDELLYLHDAQTFVDECKALMTTAGDRVIDSMGQSYSIDLNGEDTPILSPLKTVYTAYQLSQLIQAHEFSKAQVCLTKIQFAAVADAIAALAFSE